MQKYQSQIQIEIILVYRDIKHITGIYTCWLITEYIQFRPPKKTSPNKWTKNAINENGMLFKKNPTKYSGLEQNENKNELIS